jgi:methylmalonyl-CoA/ethylmalonyl-CoA epimerase
MDLELHHIGIAVGDISQAVEDHRRRFGCEPEGRVIHDPVQTAFIQFLRVRGSPALIELVAPDGPGSKLKKALEKGGGLNHLCHSTEDIESACRVLREQGMVLIHRPTPAVAFGGRRIAWLIGRDRVLIELVERVPLGGWPNPPLEPTDQVGMGSRGPGDELVS